MESRPLPGPGGEEMAKPDALMELQRVSGLSRSITQSSSPNLLVSKKRKQTLLGGTAQMAPQSPQKANKGSNPHFASASGGRKARELAEQSLRPCPAGTAAQNGHLLPGGEDARELLQFRIPIHPAGVLGCGAGEGAGLICTVRSWPRSCLHSGSSASEILPSSGHVAILGPSQAPQPHFPAF